MEVKNKSLNNITKVEVLRHPPRCHRYFRTVSLAFGSQFGAGAWTEAEMGFSHELPTVFLDLVGFGTGGGKGGRGGDILGGE